MEADPAKQWAKYVDAEDIYDSPIMAVINFFFPTWGYLLMGQYWKSVNCFITWALCLPGFILFYTGMIAALVLNALYAVDCHFLAIRVKEGKPIMQGECGWAPIKPCFWLVEKIGGVIPFVSDAPDAPGDYASKVPKSGSV